MQVPPPGQGLWSSMVLSPATNKYGAWPASGEVGGLQGGRHNGVACELHWLGAAGGQRQAAQGRISW